MVNNLKLDKAGLNLLIECEGLLLNAYKCPAGVWTIGLGNTFYEDGSPVKKGDKITKERAFELFRLIEPQFAKAVNQSVLTKLTQNEFNALFIFAWNIGTAGFKKSTLVKVLNTSRLPLEIKAAWLLWKGKKDLLLSRRNKEIKMFFS